MKINKGIYQDSNFVDQPSGFAFWVKNAVYSIKSGALNNENGFLPRAVNGLFPIDFIPIGIIEMEKEIIIFSTNNTDSEIGVYDSDTDIYTTKLNDNNVVEIKDKLNFNTKFPIEGSWTVNFQGDIIIGFTDWNNSPRVMLLNNVPNPFTSNKIDIFKDMSTVKLLTYSIDDGGGFSSIFAVYVYFRYSNFAGDVTGWTPLPNIIFLDGTNKAITLNMTGIDTSYDQIEIALYTRDGAVYSERIYKTIQINKDVTTLTTTITGQETYETLITNTLIVPSLDYRSARTITEISKQIALSNIKSLPAIRYQKYACNIKFKWKSELKHFDTFSSKLEDKGWQHDEIGAFYIRFILINGNRSQGFHIPGLSLAEILTANPTNTKTLLNTDNLDGSKNYQVNDYSTITSSPLTTTRIGTFSYWENRDEFYPKQNLPNIEDEEFNGAFNYDGVAIVGGRNLLTEETLTDGIVGRVKHFKFPSIPTFWDSYHGDFPTYGLEYLDRLGIEVDTDTIFIPDDIKPYIQGYEICYADRNSNNQTIIAQDYALLGANYGADAIYGDMRGTVSTGCNFDSTIIDASEVTVVTKTLRCHAFDLLKSDIINPSIEPSHVKFLYNIKSVTALAGDGTLWGKSSGGEQDDRYGIITTVVGATTTTKYTGLSKITNKAYIGYDTNNPTLNKDNRLLERCYVIDLQDAIPFFDYRSYSLGGDSDQLIEVLIDNIITTNNSIPYHKSASYVLFTLRSTVYEKFTDQTLIPTGKLFTTETGTQELFGGDTFLSVCAANTRGIYYINELIDEPINAGRGIRCSHSYIAETKANGNKRGRTQGDASKWFSINDIATALDFVNSVIDTNSFYGDFIVDYNGNYSFILNLIVSSIFNPNNRFSNVFPDRTIRSLPQGNDTKVLAWSFFKANDYYDIRRNRGEIVNIEQFQDNKLLISTTQATFITTNRTTLATTSLQVTLGAGDIFDVEPYELLFDKLGTVGLQHRSGCIITAFGAFIVDAAKGSIFNISAEGQVQEISLKGLRNFFLKELPTLTNDNDGYANLSINLSKIYCAYNKDKKTVFFSFDNGDRSFTISYSPEMNNGEGGWSSAHDYNPSIIFNNRYNVFSFKEIDGEYKLFKHDVPIENGGVKGVYYDDTKKSFIVDIVFNNYGYNEKGQALGTDIDKLFQSINWKTEIKSTISKYLETLTHITIRSEYQCSGRVSISSPPSIGEGNIRKTNDYWHFNDFRDLVIHDVDNPNDFTKFIDDWFNNFDVIESSLDFNMDDFEQRKFIHSYIVVRFEYDNVIDAEVSLIEVSAKAIPAFR